MEDVAKRSETGQGLLSVIRELSEPILEVSQGQHERILHVQTQICKNRREEYGTYNNTYSHHLLLSVHKVSIGWDCALLRTFCFM